MKKIICIISLCGMLLIGLGATAQASVLLVDDFDDCSKPNYLGGNFGSWDKDPDDTTQTCIDSFDGDIKYGTSGYSLKLEYDVDSPNPAYNGFWMSLNDSDLRQYNSIVFYSKGDKNDGYSSQYKIEIKNASGEVGRYLVTGITGEWTKVVIPFRKINGITDWSKVTQVVIVFDDINATDKNGIIYFDNVTFQTL